MQRQSSLPYELKIHKDLKTLYKRLLWSILATVAIIALLLYRGQFQGSILLPIILLISPVFLILKFTWEILNKIPLLIINKEGIWTKQNEHHPWKNIWYYYIAIQEKEGAPSVSYIIFKLRMPEEEIRINLQFSSIPQDDILDYIILAKGN
jgi:hypothetical protein